MWKAIASEQGAISVEHGGRYFIATWMKLWRYDGNELFTYGMDGAINFQH